MQEAVTNVARHAQAHNVWVELTRLDTALDVRIRDDGIGCDLAAMQARARSGRSMGILSMEERTRFVRGSIHWISAPNQGTEVHALFPGAFVESRNEIVSGGGNV